MNDSEVTVPLTDRSTDNGIKVPPPPGETSDVIVACCAAPFPSKEQGVEVSDIARQLEYRVGESPPIHLCCLYGLQVKVVYTRTQLAELLKTLTVDFCKI